jgi:hypothetical protein
VSLRLTAPDGQTMEEGVRLPETGAAVEVWVDGLGLAPERRPAAFDVRVTSSLRTTVSGQFHLDETGPIAAPGR